MRRTVFQIGGTFALALFSWTPGLLASTVVLNFQDLNPQNVDGPLFIPSPYQNQGFSISSTLGFDTYGSGLTNFFAGAKSLSPIIGSAVQLNAIDSSPFTLTSIDLARNFLFDPAPTVTFMGLLQGGGTVTQSFTVTTPAGEAAFQTFDFTNFSNLIAVTWSQPASASEGLHQFTDIVLQTGPPTTVPEPGTLSLAAFAVAVGFAMGKFRRRSHVIVS